MPIRRWSMAAVAIAVAALAGCQSLPSGADGDLVDDWSALAEVTAFVPAQGVCHPDPYETFGRRTAYAPVDCATAHYGETVFVGAFDGDVAAAAAPPDPSTVDAAAAYAVCDAKATEFAGRQWRDARLSLDVTVPSPEAWEGGARWFRCELNALTTVTEQPDWVARTGSLAGALPDDLLLGCFAESGSANAVEKMPELDCAKSHNAEYAGTFLAEAAKAYPKSKSDWNYFHDKCRKVVADFVGIPVTQVERYGVISWPYSADTWAGGDRGVRCFLWLDAKKMTGSAKGTKGKGVPY